MDNLSSFYFTLANPVADARRRRSSTTCAATACRSARRRGYAVARLRRRSRRAARRARRRARRSTSSATASAALVALAFAAAHPERVARLALIDAHDGTEGWAAQMTATLALQGDARDAKIAESFQSWLGRHSERKRTRLATRSRGARRAAPRSSPICARSPPLDRGELARSRCPVLALYGETLRRARARRGSSRATLPRVHARASCRAARTRCCGRRPPRSCATASSRSSGGAA